MSESKTSAVLQEELAKLPPAPADDPFSFVAEVQHFLKRWLTAYPKSVSLGSPAYSCFIGQNRISAFSPESKGFQARFRPIARNFSRRCLRTASASRLCSWVSA